MLRDELIGSWKQKGGGSVMHLHADGNAVCEGHTKTGEVIREPAVWKYLGERHWNLCFAVDPLPGVEGMEERAIEVTEYQVVSFTPGRMELAVFDFEFPVVYERI